MNKVKKWYGNRGVFGGGFVATKSYKFFNTIEYISISENSNSVDFGDLTVSRADLASYSNGIGGVFGGGYNGPENRYLKIIDSIIIENTSNASNFGTITTETAGSAACSGD